MKAGPAQRRAGRLRSRRGEAPQREEGDPHLVRSATAAAVPEPRRSRSASARAAPSTSPRRRTGAASPTRGAAAETPRSTNPEPIGLLIVSGDEAAANPDVRALAEQAERVHRHLDVPRARRRLGRPRPPGHELPRARRDVRQPRGTAAAPAAHRHPARAGRARLDLEARRALRRRDLAVSLGGLRRGLGDRVRRHPVR